MIVLPVRDHSRVRHELEPSTLEGRGYYGISLVDSDRHPPRDHRSLNRGTSPTNVTGHHPTEGRAIVSFPSGVRGAHPVGIACSLPHEGWQVAGNSEREGPLPEQPPGSRRQSPVLAIADDAHHGRAVLRCHRPDRKEAQDPVLTLNTGPTMCDSAQPARDRWTTRPISSASDTSHGSRRCSQSRARDEVDRATRQRSRCNEPEPRVCERVGLCERQGQNCSEREGVHLADRPPGALGPARELQSVHRVHRVDRTWMTRTEGIRSVGPRLRPDKQVRPRGPCRQVVEELKPVDAGTPHLDERQASTSRRCPRLPTCSPYYSEETIRTDTALDVLAAARIGQVRLSTAGDRLVLNLVSQPSDHQYCQQPRQHQHGRQGEAWSPPHQLQVRDASVC